MGTDAIIGVQEPLELRVSMRRGIKAGFLVPELHNGIDDPLGLAGGSGVAHPGEALLDVVLGTQQHKRMLSGITLVLFPVIGIGVLNSIGAFITHLVQKFSGRVLGVIRQYGCIQLPAKIINGDKQVYPRGSVLFCSACSGRRVVSPCSICPG